MVKVRAAAVYARISSDLDGTALGVGRQLKDCRRLATDLGWGVAEEYVDNDVSAFGNVNRDWPQRAHLIWPHLALFGVDLENGPLCCL